MSRPTFISTIPRGTDIANYELGLTMIGLDPTPQGRIMAGVLEAKAKDGTPRYSQVAGLVPRRAAKTTSVWATLLGRLATVDDYRIVTTAQDGQRARNIFREFARRLEANGFEDRGGTIRWSNGDERLTFPNDSQLWVVPPIASAFRSEAADVLLFDEAGELDPVKSEDLLSGALPLLDTRATGQAIIVGTPAEVRAGLLWDALQEGRARKRGAGIFEWSIRDDEQAIIRDDDGNIALDRAILRRVHPGIGTLTTMPRMLSRFEKMQPTRFEREYLCRFPFDQTVSAIDMEKWAAAEGPEPALPEKFGLAFDVAPDGSSAAIVAAWRDAEGLAHVGVLEHREGVSWLARTVNAIGRKYRVPVRYDAIGANHAPAEEAGRLRGVSLLPSGAKDVQGATQRFVSALADGKLRHHGQASLTAAAEGATWRQSEGGRYFARKASKADVSPLVAATLALWQVDTRPERARQRILTSHDTPA